MIASLKQEALCLAMKIDPTYFLEEADTMIELFPSGTHGVAFWSWLVADAVLDSYVGFLSPGMVLRG